MKTALILTIDGNHWLIPQATTTDAGRLLALFGNAIQVREDYQSIKRKWKPYDYGMGICHASPQVAMVDARDVSLTPDATQEHTARSNRAKPVQAISSTPILRLEGGGS